VTLGFFLSLLGRFVDDLVVGERMGVGAGDVRVHQRRSLPLTDVLGYAISVPVEVQTEPPAVCTSTGTEIAYPLSSMRNSTGSFRVEALFNASQNSPSLVVPSPAET